MRVRDKIPVTGTPIDGCEYFRYGPRSPSTSNLMRRDPTLLPAISRATRNEFREVLTRGFVLREIADIFTGAGFSDEVTYEGWGNRRKLVEDYYKTLDPATQSAVASLLSALNAVAARLAASGNIDGIGNLIRLMEQDGYNYENGTFMPMDQGASATGGKTMWSLSNFNLICYSRTEEPVFRSQTGNATFLRNRLFEHTSDELKHQYEDDLGSLAKLPSLIVAEAKPGGKPGTPAFLADIDDVRVAGEDIRFRFRRIETERFSSEEVFGSPMFDINTQGYEHSRMHWAIKETNLLEGLFLLFRDRVHAEEKRFPSIAKPRFFNVKDWPPPVLGHVAVMMPFDPSYDVVYDAICAACGDHKLDAERVDKIFGPNVVMDDIFRIIVQSRFVISDLTKRNPNVLYETGIAHARNCDVIMIVQDENDIPFDLRHIRYVKYLPNSEGYRKLRVDLAKSIGAILEES